MKVVNLTPHPIPGSVYIVSAMVRSAVPDRKDVYSPGSLVRDEEGRILGCRDLLGN